MTVFQIIVGILGVIVYIIMTMRGATGKVVIITFIVSLLLIAGGVADLRKKKQMAQLSAPENQEKEE